MVSLFRPRPVRLLNRWVSPIVALFLLLTLLLASAGATLNPRTTAAVFHARLLRLHDNPVLLSSLSCAPGTEILPIFLGDTGECADALGVLQRQLKVQHNAELSFARTTTELMTTLKQHSVDGGVVWSSRGAEHDQEMHTAASAAGLRALSVRDGLFSSASEIEFDATLSAAKTQAELSFAALEGSVYSRAVLPSTVPLPDMTRHLEASFVTSPDAEKSTRLEGGGEASLQGEELGLHLVQEYVTLGDVEFTAKYGDLYISGMSRSAEHQRSLQRLAQGGHLCRGEVLSGLLSPLLVQGCVSSRLLVHARTVLPSAASLGLSSVLGCELSKEAVRKHWHASLSTAALKLSRQNKGSHSSWAQGFDYWRGYTYRYGVMRPATAAADKGEHVFVLLHGFGGSVDQFTGLGRELAKRGYPSVALDSLGFGLCEKPPLSFNQYLWRDQVTEFISGPHPALAEFRGRKVVLVGNSIGGFCAAACASVLKKECAGLVLVNTAGRVLEEDPNPSSLDQSESERSDANFLFSPYAGPSPFVLSLVGKVIFSLLQPRILGTTQWLYPTNPSLVASSGLAENILRDSQDPGASDVIAAGGKLPPSRSMNALFDDYGGPVLIAQGALDPLNDAPTRAAMFGRIREGVAVELLQSGHCAHDETPDLVADAIVKWLPRGV